MSYPVEPLSAKRNMIWNSAGSLTYFACQWLTTIVVVRLSGGFTNAGILALVMSVYNIFQPFAAYRMYTYQVSDIKRENSTGEYLAFRSLTCFLAFSICFIYAAATCSFEAFVAVVLYCLYKAISLLIEILHGYEQLNFRMDYMGKSMALQGILSLGAFSGVLVLQGGIHLAIASMIVTNLLVAAVYDLPRYLSFEEIHFGISAEKVKHLLRYCFPIVVSSVVFSAAMSIPRQYLSVVWGDDFLGIYASVAAPAVIVQMGATYLYNPLLSTFAEYYQQNVIKKFLRLLFKTIAGIVILALLSTVVLVIAYPWLFGLMFGEKILSYGYLLIPVMGVTTLTAFMWFMSDLLVVVRAFKGSFVGNLVAFAVALPATYLCVNTWDMNGVSFAGIFSCLAGAIVMSIFVIKALKGLFVESKK